MRPLMMVVGSHDFPWIETVPSTIRSLGRGTVMTSQMGPVERVARDYAEQDGRGTMTYLSDWNERDDQSVWRQQMRMVNTRPDLVVAFWSGTTVDGVVFALREAIRLGINYTVIAEVDDVERLKRLVCG